MSDFTKIIEFAKSKDHRSLRRLLANGIAIDVQENGQYFSPAETLAASGDVHSAEFLRRHGANMNKIARGYARSAQYELIAHYHEKLDADLTLIAQGYAMANDTTTADNLRRTEKVDANSIAFGFAFAGNLDQVNEYILVHRVTIQVVINGYIIGEHFEEALTYCENPTVNINQMATLSAFMGNHDTVERLRHHPRALPGINNDIAKGYAQSGNQLKVQEALERGAHVDFVARGYAEGGHYREAYSHVTNMTRNTEFIAYGLSDGGHLETIQEAMRAIVFIQDVNFRNRLMDHVFLRYPELNAAIDQIERTRALMNSSHQLDYEDALFIASKQSRAEAASLHADRHLVTYQAAAAMTFPEIQHLILQCAHQGIFAELPFTLIGEIASYLTPFESHAITVGLHKIARDRHTSSLRRDLAHYAEPSLRNLFHFYKRTARELITITSDPSLTHDQRVLAVNAIYARLPTRGRNSVREIVDAHKNKFKL